MRCPVDGETLVMTERYGIEIDYCPKCRGVWLDRGELDKIIERALAEADGEAPSRPAPAAQARARPQNAPVHQPEPQRAPQSYREDDRRWRDDDDDYRHGHDYRHGQGYKTKRRKSFLADIFDF